MNTNNQTSPAKTQENVIAGIVGAFLFALAGGILWVVLDRIGFVAGISGIVGVIAANRGYTFFAKGSSKKGVILSTVIAILVLVIAWYLCFCIDLSDAYKMWYENGEVDYLPSYFECVATGFFFFEDPEIAQGYITTLLIGLALAIVASIPTFKQLMQEQKAAEEAPVETEYTYNTEAASTESTESAPEETKTESATEEKTEKDETTEA